jgi:RNA polymerase sigma-70 factor (ECF subfamily)
MPGRSELGDLDDAGLVDRFNAGEVEAFEQLYMRHRDWVVNLAYRLSGDRDLALDVMQDAFEHLLDRFPGFVLRARMTTYLYPVVRNLVVTARRRAGRAAASGPHPFALASVPDRSEDARVLTEMLATLPAPHREILILRFVEDLTLDEIATVLEVPLGTVKSRLHHALRTLREDDRAKKYFER